MLLTTSCTHALEMAVLLLDVGPGDEVICPPFTFVSSVNAFVLRGAVPVFVDIRPDTLNLDERLVEAAITPRTRAILLVHYAGVGCEMDVLDGDRRRHGLPLIEDNAHGLFGRYRGRAARQRRRHLDAELPRDQEPDLRRGRRPGDQRPGARRAGRGPAREGHQSQPLLPRAGGQVHLGATSARATCPRTSWPPTCWAQLEARDAIQARRQALWSRYDAELAGWARPAGVAPADRAGPDCEHPAHIFYLLMPSLAARTALIAHLRARQILAVFHYLPLHLSEQGRRYGGARRTVSGHRGRRRIGWCGCRCTTT